MENDSRIAHREVFEKSERRFSDLAEVSSDWFWETDKDLRFTYMSERVFEAMGVKPEFFYGKTRQELTVIDENREGWSRHFRDLEDRKPFMGFTYRRLGPKDDVQWIRASGVPFFDSIGEFQGYRGAGSNITEVVSARETARVYEQRFRDVVESSFDRFWETDEKHRFSFFSDTSDMNDRFPQNNLIGQTRWGAAGLSEDYDENWRRHVEDLNAHRPFRGFQFRSTEGNGDECFFRGCPR